MSYARPGKFRIWAVLAFATVVCAAFVVGCTSKAADSTDQNYVMYNRYGAPAVINYIDTYGNDYEKTQSIEAGKVYETMTWRTKGVAVKYLLETGQIVKEEKFSTFSTTR